MAVIAPQQNDGATERAGEKENVNTHAYGIQRKAECPRTCAFSPSVSFALIKEIYTINLAGSVRTFARPRPQGALYKPGKAD